MKTFWKIIGFTFLTAFILLILAIVGGLLFLKSFDIKKYKPQIIQSVTQALGRPIDFKDIQLEVSLDKGIRMHLGNLTIAESPEFGDGSFVTIKQVDAGVDILSYILSHQVSVPSIIINSPQIEIIRNAQGILNISSLGQAGNAKSAGASSAVALPVIFINSLKIENAQIALVDKSISPELRLAITQLTLDVQRFSLSNPFDVLLEAALLSSEKNFRLEGKAQLRLDNKEVRLSDMGISLKLGQLPLGLLRSSPMLAAVPFPQLLDGEMKVKIKEAEISDKGLEKLLADASLSGGKIIAPDIVPGISLEAKQIEFVADNLSLDNAIPANVSLKAAVYQDMVNIDFGAKVIFDLKTAKVQISDGQFATDLSLWPMKRIKAQIVSLRDVPLPETLNGKIQTSIKEFSLTPAGLQRVLLDVKLEDGAADLSALVPGIPASFSKTDLIISNFSFGKQFSVILKTAYLNDVQNLSFDGIVSFDPATQVVEIKNGLAGIDLNNIPLDKIKSSSLVPAGTPFPKLLGGRLQLQLHDLAASSKGLDLINMSLKWQTGKIAIDELTPGVSMAANQINLEIQNFSMSQFFGVKGSLGYESDDPNVFIDGQVNFDMLTQKVDLKDFDIMTDLSKFAFERIKSQVAPLKDIKLPDILKGELSAHVKELSGSPQGLGPMVVDLDLKNGEVGMQNIAPGISVAASQINADIKNFSTAEPFYFTVGMAYLSDVPNIQTFGTMQLNLTKQNVSLTNSQMQVDLAEVSFERLKAAITSLKDVSLPQSLKGQLNVAIPNVSVGPTGLMILNSEISLKDWEAKLKELMIPISGSETKLTVTESRLIANDLRFNLGQGQITAKADVEDYLTKQTFDLSAEIKDLNLKEILEQSQSPVKVEGLVSANIKVTGQGADMNAVTGDGNVEVRNAKLKDFNVLKEVLNKISLIPNLSERVQAKLPEEYLAKLEDKDTTLTKVAGTIVVSSGHLVVEPLSVEADEFILNGNIQADFDQNYVVDGSFKITPELSAIMGDSTEELQYMYDANNLISIPIHATGKGAGVPQMAILQSLGDLGKNAVRTQAKKEIKRALGKVFGDSDESLESSTEDSESTSQEDPGSKIIGGILDKVFK